MSGWNIRDMTRKVYIVSHETSLTSLGKHGIELGTPLVSWRIFLSSCLSVTVFDCASTQVPVSELVSWSSRGEGMKRITAYVCIIRELSEEL